MSYQPPTQVTPELIGPDNYREICDFIKDKIAHLDRRLQTFRTEKLPEYVRLYKARPKKCRRCGPDHQPRARRRLHAGQRQGVHLRDGPSGCRSLPQRRPGRPAQLTAMAGGTHGPDEPEDTCPSRQIIMIHSCRSTTSSAGSPRPGTSPTGGWPPRST